MSTGTIFKKDIPLKDYSLIRIGGKADFFFSFENDEELIKAFDTIKNEDLNYLLIGNSSNIVFSDKGFRGVVLHQNMKEIKLSDDGSLYVEAGVLIGQFISFATNNELGGVQALTWIPGTIGGAIYGNAGAYGLEISNHLVSVRYFDPDDMKVHEVIKDELVFDYRTSTFKQKDWIILSAIFNLPPLKDEDKERVQDVINQRKLKIPSKPSCGSFFKNPENDYAGRLIDELGLKGYAEGDIQVSDIHANIIINNGNGTQEDLIKLTKNIKQKVKNKFNIELHPEVIVLDEYGKLIPI